eukprot:299811-Ditylum_brightwellii.AAC.1
MLWNQQKIETTTQQVDAEQTLEKATEEAIQYDSGAMLIAGDVTAHVSKLDCYSRKYNWAQHH